MYPRLRRVAPGNPPKPPRAGGLQRIAPPAVLLRTPSRPPAPLPPLLSAYHYLPAFNHLPLVRPTRRTPAGSADSLGLRPHAPTPGEHPLIRNRKLNPRTDPKIIQPQLNTNSTRTEPNPTQLNPTQLNPTQLNPTEPNPPQLA